MKNYPWLGSLLGGLALAITALLRVFTVSPKMGFTALPIEPTSGATENATLKVASAIKPTATPGSVVASLNEILDTGDPDVKFAVFLPVSGEPRVVMLPISVSDATALAGEALVATITPDEETGESVPWTAAVEAGFTEADDAFELEFGTATKPRKNISAIINAVIDAIRPLQASGEAMDGSAIAVTYDQSTDEVKVYTTATAGTLTGKLGDVQMLAAEPGGSSRSLRFGS